MRKLKLILHPKQIEGDHVGTRNLISTHVFVVAKFNLLSPITRQNQVNIVHQTSTVSNKPGKLLLFSF